MESVKVLKPKVEHKSSTDGERKLLSHRVQFVSTRQFVEDNFPFIAQHLKSDDAGQVKNALLWFANHLVWDTGFAFETATKKAIAEASSLIQDPDYYETVRIRRQRDRARRKADEQEQWEKRHNPPPPTLADVQRDLRYVAQSVIYHEGNLAALAVRANELRQKEAALLVEQTEAEEGVM